MDPLSWATSRLEFSRGDKRNTAHDGLVNGHGMLVARRNGACLETVTVTAITTTTKRIEATNKNKH
jgi:hypothetical protein